MKHLLLHRVILSTGMMLLGGCGGENSEQIDPATPADAQVEDATSDQEDDGGSGCGNGEVEPGEECDDGAANSDLDANACRTDCVLPSCGDGVVDDSEECDSGDERSDSVRDACRLDCLVPRCGDGVVDTGEACDDGNDEDTDACENSCTPSECTEDADCDNGLYCDGPERCVDAQCTPGAAPEPEDGLDDGIDCTVDSCNEAEDGFDHTPTDTLCNGLDRAPYCGSTDFTSGQLLQDIGVCSATDGCLAETSVVENCLAEETTLRCEGDEIRRRTPICIPAAGGSPARCGFDDALEQSCASAIPGDYPYCSGSADADNLTHHFDPTPLCAIGDGGEPSCTFTESTQSCGAPAPACSDGELTTIVATCSPTDGCGTVSNASDCPTHTPSCERNTLITYQPTCASAASCGEPIEVATRCVAENRCDGDRFERRAPTCDASAGSCGERVVEAVDCGAVDTCTVFSLGGGCGMTFTQGQCTSIGCTTDPGNMFCPSGGCSCSPTPHCE